MNKNESKEDYLERIYVLRERNDSVRAIDIANSLGFSRPSVSIALKKLKDLDLISIEDNEIYLTPAGRDIATNIFGKHKLLKSFFMKLGVNEKTASEDACKVEHILADETFRKIREFVDNN